MLRAGFLDKGTTYSEVANREPCRGTAPPQRAVMVRDCPEIIVSAFAGSADDVSRTNVRTLVTPRYVG